MYERRTENKWQRKILDVFNHVWEGWISGMIGRVKSADVCMPRPAFGQGSRCFLFLRCVFSAGSYLIFGIWSLLLLVTKIRSVSCSFNLLHLTVCKIVFGWVKSWRNVSRSGNNTTGASVWLTASHVLTSDTKVCLHDQLYFHSVTRQPGHRDAPTQIQTCLIKVHSLASEFTLEQA